MTLKHEHEHEHEHEHTMGMKHEHDADNRNDKCNIANINTQHTEIDVLNVPAYYELLEF